MRILFISSNYQNDFLCDTIFHGLVSDTSNEVIDLNPLWYMYDTVDKKSLVNRFHGRGFTFCGTLPSVNIDRSNIPEKIANKYFDKIVYGNVHRCLDLIELVSENYSHDDIILLDGQDETKIIDQLVSVGKYFKRELTESDSKNYPSIKPISFAFPKEKIKSDIPKKEKLLAQIIPGVMHTFIYNDEETYFNDYRESMFGYTWKKSGWDCLRHYEILANDCIPLFLDIKHCPKTNCTTLPKDLLIEYYEKSGLIDIFDFDAPIEYDDRCTLILNRDLSSINNFEINDESYDLYLEYLQKLKEYTMKNLTSIEIGKYILQ
jgi:hypothetical protein